MREILPQLGFSIGEKAIQIDDAQVDKIIKSWEFYQKREKLKQKLAEKQTKAQEEAAKQQERTLVLPPFITVSEFAKKLSIDVTKIIIKLMGEGIMAAMNQKIDYETAHIVAEDFGVKTALGEEESSKKEKGVQELSSVIAKEETLEPRPPVVVVMGHVDHGKTTLLDTIRKTHVAEGESGAITQHIGAYQVKLTEEGVLKGKLITFIDTPGHEAFKGMRQRGGRVADIAILVIAADDKIQPQTLEAIEIIQQENLSLIVAINKIDKPDADPERIKKQLAEINLIPEEWGGDTICVPISAKASKNITDLLEHILLVAEVQEIKANAEGVLYGTVIESHIDKGLGPVATAIIQNGTLRVGDFIQAGGTVGKIKTLQSYSGVAIECAPPSTPVCILGFKMLPAVSDIIHRVASSKEAKRLAKKQKPVSYPRDAETKKGGIKRQLKIYLRTDVDGTREALLGEIGKIKHEEAEIHVVESGLGNFTGNTILEAEAGGAQLIGFKVGASQDAEHLINTRRIPFKTYTVIYELLDDLKRALEKIIPSEITEEDMGEASVLQIFGKQKDAQIAGCSVTEGKVMLPSKFRVFRGNEAIGEGSVLELQSNKQAVKQVNVPQEFGLKVKSDVTLKEGDKLSFYITHQEKKKLA